MIKIIWSCPFCLEKLDQTCTFIENKKGILENHYYFKCVHCCNFWYCTYLNNRERVSKIKFSLKIDKIIYSFTIDGVNNCVEVVDHIWWKNFEINSVIFPKSFSKESLENFANKNLNLQIYS